MLRRLSWKFMKKIKNHYLIKWFLKRIKTPILE
jgi:hypothetical protein